MQDDHIVYLSNPVYCWKIIANLFFSGLEETEECLNLGIQGVEDVHLHQVEGILILIFLKVKINDSIIKQKPGKIV